MEPLLIPSLTAIALKIAIFVRYHQSLRRENLALGIFFLAVFLFNIVEILAIKPQFGEQTLLLILVAYYCCTVFLVHGYLNLCLEYSGFNWHLSKIRVAMNVLLAFLIVNVIFNRAIIAGVELTSVAMTRVDGGFYWLISLYIFGSMTAGLALLVAGFRNLSSNLSRQRCLVFLISVAPAATTGIVVVTLMTLGINITAVVVLSLALTVMLCVLVYTEEKTRLFHLLTLVPFTKERRLHQQLLAQITNCIAISDDPNDSSSLNLKHMMKQLEGTVGAHVLAYYGGNQKLAASALGVSEATISRRARSAMKKDEKTSETISASSGDSVSITT